MTVPMEIASIDGIELAYRLAGNESGQPIILLHGYTGNHRNWAYTAQALIAAGWRTLSPDTPGHGASAAPENFEEYKLERVAALIERLAEGLDCTPAVLVGHSMGAAIAEECAIRSPQAVRALVLVGSAGGGVDHDVGQRVPIAAHIDELREAYREGGMAAVFDRQMALGLRPDTERSTRRMRQLLREEFARTSWAGFEYGGLALRTRSETLSSLASWSKPAMVVHGESEAPRLVRVAEELHGAMPHARREVIPGAGHTPQIEAPQAFNRVLVDFLAELSRQEG